MTDLISIDSVKSRLLTVRGQATLLDRDVATLYGVQTREVNQTVRNNPDKFPEGYCLQLTATEFADWKSKILISNLSDSEQTKQLTQAGHKLANLIGENLSTDSTETTIELNLAVLKITHKFTRNGRARTPSAPQSEKGAAA